MILPACRTHFEWRTTAEGPVLVCQPLERHAPHAFTTRHWRLGGDRGQRANQEADRAGRDEASARERAGAIDDGWGEVARAMGHDRDRLVRMQQVHGCAVAVADATLDPPVADVLVTRDPSVAIAVQVADCIPLLLADARTGAVAASHAGWRGLAARVPDVTVQAMKKEFGSRPEDLIAAIGPAIGACCYEVGEDVREAFRAGWPTDTLDRWFSIAPALLPDNPPMRGLPRPSRPGHFYFDTWRAVRDQLSEVGIAADCVFVAGLCTASHPGTLCSYRRDGARAGRLVAAIAPAESPRHVSETTRRR